MTDQELLELAAKAAGADLRWDNGGNGKKYPWIVGRDGQETWNPLEDDGDALRLAVVLKINIEHAETLSRAAHGVNCWPVGRWDCAWMENDIADYGAATRRAITRAAAEIQRAREASRAPNVAGNRLARQGQSELTGLLGPGSEA